MADETNPYLASAAGLANQNLRVSLNASVDSQPDAEAKLQFFATKYGLPVDSVRDSRAEVESRSLVDDIAAAAAKYPTVSATLSDPKVARIAHDDVDNMTGVERIIGEFKNTGGALMSGFNNFNVGLAGLIKAPAELGQQVGDVTGLSRLQFQWQRDSYKWQMGMLDRYIGNQQALAKQNFPTSENPIVQGAYSGVQSIPGTLGALALAAMGRPDAGAALMAAPVGGQAYVQGRDEGLNPAQSVVFGAEQGTVEFLTEKLTAGAFAHGQGKSFLTQLAKTMAAEIPGEQVATIMQDFNEWAVLPSNADKPFSAYLAERPNAALQTAVATVVGTGAGAVTVRATEAAGRRVMARQNTAARAEATISQTEALGQLNELVAASKVRARDPATFERFVAAATEDGPVSHVYVDAAQLDALADNPEAVAALNQLPSVVDQIGEARATGGDVAIPVEEFTRLAGTPASEALIPHLRTEPDGFTSTEAEAYLSEHGPKLADEIASILGEQLDDAAFRASRDVVQEKIAGQLTEAARFTPDVNTAYAGLTSAFYATQAQRMGITPEEMFQRYPLRVTADALPQSAAVLDQPFNLSEGSHDAQIGEATISYQASPAGVLISKVAVPEDARRQGKAREAMTALTQQADQEGKALFLTADPIGKGGASKAALTKFYKSLGFVPNTGKAKVFEGPQAGMVRQPQARKTDLKALMAQTKANTEARQQQAKALASTGKPVRLEKGDGRTALVGPDMSKPGGFRVTRVDVDGEPNGHVEYTSFEEALNEALREGYAPSEQTLQQSAQTTTPEFKAWFGDSKIVDDEGNPLVVFHGTADDVTEFDLNHPNRKDSGWLGTGVYLTDSHFIAESYARLKEKGDDRRNIMPLYAKIENPYYATLEEKQELREYGREGADEWTQQLKEKGYDGVILDFLGGGREIVVFDPKGVKSAIGNTGAFNPNDTSILNQSARGKFNPQTLTMSLMNAADLSTFLHESGHFYLEVLADLASQPGAPQAIVDDMASVLKWFDSQTPEGESGPADGLAQSARKTTDPTIYWHGSVSGDLRGGSTGLHLGTKQAAKEALEARIGIPAEGEWDGTREYGKTLLAGKATMRRMGVWPTGFNVDAPEEDYYPSEGRLKYADKTYTPLTVKPNITPFRLDTEMSNTKSSPHEDFKANGYMAANIKKGTAKRGFYYKNVGEDAGSVSVVVPNGSHLIPVTEGFEQGGDQGTPAQGPLTLERWRAMSLDEQRFYHEKFARGFEAYLFEGKAPSEETRGMFQRFRAWMVSVYRQLSSLNVELNDDIREVFGRLLATEDQIAESERAQGFAALFETKPETMSDDEWANYQRLGAQATQDAIHKLESRSVRDMKWLSGARSRLIRRLQNEASEKRKAIRAEVAAEVDAEPVNRARTFLKRGTLNGVEAEGPTKLNLDDVKALYDHLPEELRDYAKLGYGKYGMLSNEGMHPDEAAELFGYPSGEALIEDLLNAEDPQVKIKGITDQRMLERYGDLTDDMAIERAADEALHNDARMKFVATEYAALANATGGRKVLNKAAKDFAAQIVGRLTLKKLKPNRFSAAERRAAVRAAEAHGKGELVTAATEKRNQLINGYATRAAHDAVAEVEKAKVLFRRIAAGKDDALARTRDMDFVNAARAVLSAYGIGRAKNNPEHYMKLLREYDPAMADLLEPMVDNAAANAKPLDEATVDELRALRDTVNQLWFLSRRVRQMEIDGVLHDRSVVAAELSARLDAMGVPDRSGQVMGLSDGEKRVRQLSGVRAALRRVEHWVRNLDGADKGPFRKFLWQPISEAADRYRSDRLRYITALREIMQPIADTLKVGKIAAPELGVTFGTGARGVGKSQLLHAILHTGNQSNKRKLLLGRGWAKELPDGTLDTSQWDAFIDRMHRENVLTKADYDFAQAVWDLLEQTKPGAQKAHRAVVGRYFAEVTADPFETPFGTYAGGYVPATVDTDLVQDAAIKQAEENLTAASQASMFPSPAKGFTMSRVEYNKPLELDLSLLPRHLDKVLKFTHFAAPTQDAVRLLGAKGFSAKLEAFDPEAKTELLIPWLNRASKQITETAPGSKAGQAFANVARAINSRTGLGIMFGNLTNALQQLTGWSVSAVLVKPRHLAGGLVTYTRDPMGSTHRVREASSFMATRTDNQLYDVETHVRDILLNPGVIEQSQRWSSKHGYFLQSAFQNVVDVSTWIGAYNEATERGDEDRDAIRHADSVVRLTQGSMAPEDVSQFEAGSPFVKLFTKFQGYFNNMANLLGTEFGMTARDLGLQKGAGRMLYVYTLGFAIPAIMSQGIVDLMRGGWDDDDDDGYLDSLLNLLFGSQVRFALGLAPVAGPIGNAILNNLDNKVYNDRISISPAISVIESAAKAPKEIYKAIVEGGRASPAIKDTLSLLTLATGIPLTILGKPAGYLADVAQGKTDPTGPVDYTRGVVTGVASPASKVK